LTCGYELIEGVWDGGSSTGGAGFGGACLGGVPLVGFLSAVWLIWLGVGLRAVCLGRGIVEEGGNGEREGRNQPVITVRNVELYTSVIRIRHIEMMPRPPTALRARLGNRLVAKPRVMTPSHQQVVESSI
jgi:hypothetical protein